MPELPEVQTIVDDLNKTILNKKIKRVEIRLPKIAKCDDRDFCTVLKNISFQKISRWGKYIIVQLSREGEYLVVHLRMTGQIIYIDKKKVIAGGHSTEEESLDLPNKQTHLIIYFQDNSKLFYNDQRQFGFWQIVNSKELKQVRDKLGLNPLYAEFNLLSFKKLLKKRKGNIKAFLLNQKYIAGLGNIYTDESLFRAHILPFRKINNLTSKEIKKLYQAIKDILNLSVKHRGTTFNNYVDAGGRKGKFIKFLKVYKKEGQKCSRCGKEKIKKIKVAGRGTRYCPYCQK
jgi:formamidopyrimidine-DNA glycosylase